MDQFAADLESLGPLDREHLHVFVAGPGFGEGVAVALPGQGWLLIDSCEVRFGGIALLSVVERWRSSEEEPVEALMFTHPHQDHCEGLPLLLERFQPSRVLVAGVDSEPGALELQRRYWEQVSQESEGAEQAIGVAATVRTALKAIRTWEDLGPGRAVTWVADGWATDLAGGRVRLEILAPAPTAMADLFADQSKLRHLRAIANQYSLVARLTFGNAVILLGGDLPHLVDDRVLTTGWKRLVARDPALHLHVGLKVPHHGSDAALHQGVLERGPGDVQRCWWVTPYNHAPRLPSFEPGAGIGRLLETQSRVDLTALPASRRMQKPLVSPGVVRRGEIVESGARRSRSPFTHGATPLRTEGLRPQEALDAVWCCSFDDRGGILGRWRGRVAVTVVE